MRRSFTNSEVENYRVALMSDSPGMVKQPTEFAPSKDRRFDRGYVFVVALGAALGGLMFGYDWVVIGGAELFYERYFHLS
jgi:hypothetical protein